MELIKAEIAGFGKWQQTNFDFVKGNQLFFGLNEEGKSTLYQFIIVMLFGFPNKGKRRRSYEPADGASFGGRLWISHPVYGSLLIERFRGKNRGKATVFKDGNRFDEDYLTKVLSPLTEDSFRKVFTLNQEQLTDLNQLQENELHELLTSLGAVGSADIFQTRQRFDNQAQSIYKRRGLRQPLNEKLRQLQQLQKKVRDKQDQEESFGRLIQQREKLQQELNQLAQKNAKLQEDNLIFAQQEAHWPQYEEWQRLQQAHAQISDQELAFLNEEYQKYQQLAKRIEELAEQREKAQDTSNLGNDFYFYLENEEQIQQVLQKEPQLRVVLERLNQRGNQKDQDFLENYQAVWGWSPQFPPQTLSTAEQERFRNDYQQLLLEEQQLHLRLQLADEQRAQLDQEVELLEADENLQRPAATSTKTLPLVLIGSGLVAGVFSILGLNGVARGLGFLLAGLLLVGGGYLTFFNKQSQQKATGPQTGQRKLWQEKLVQLDQVQGVIFDYEEELKTNEMGIKQLQQNFSEVIRSHHLGNLTLENFSEGLQDLTYYLKVLADFSEGQAVFETAQQEAQQFFHDIQFLSPWLPLKDSSIPEIFQQIKDFAHQMQMVKASQSQQQILFIQQDFLQQTKLQRESLTQLQPFMERFKLKQPSDLVTFIEAENQLRAAEKRLMELEPVIAEFFPMELTKTEFQYGQTVLRKEIDATNQHSQRVLQEEQRLTAEIQQMEADGRLDELYAQLAGLETEVQQLALEWSQYKIAENLLGDLSTELSNVQLPALLSKASHFIEILTEGRYQSIEYQEDLVLRAQRQTFSLFELSTGTRDQVMMAIRFGFLALEKNRQLAPIMIDDGWLHYDYRRKQQLAKLLAEFGKEQQIICFSSDREMLSYYQEFQQSVNYLGGNSLEKN